ncbi:MAG: phosphotransferase family protein [Bacteroidota bacterium]
MSAEIGPVRPHEVQDWPKLESYLRDQLPKLEGSFSVQQFYGGHANLTYLLCFGDQEMVLRRPPFGKLAPGTHSMSREYRVLSALAPHYDRAPKAYHYCDDDSVIGAPFILMERCEGVIIRRSMAPAFAEMEEVEQSVSKAMIEAMAALHSLDVDQAGLTHLGKPEGYLDRQLAGCAKRWSLAETEPTPGMPAVLERLAKQIPTPQKVSVVHHDIKLDNCQFQPDNPHRVTTILDWDMTTLGDPLLDFGASLSFWPDPLLKGYNKVPVLPQGDFPSKDQLKAWYAEFTGLDLSGFAWYEALSYCKTAVIAQQLYKRYADGATKDQRMAVFGGLAQAMVQLANAKY